MLLLDRRRNASREAREACGGEFLPSLLWLVRSPRGAPGSSGLWPEPLSLFPAPPHTHPKLHHPPVSGVCPWARLITQIPSWLFL